MHLLQSYNLTALTLKIIIASCNVMSYLIEEVWVLLTLCCRLTEDSELPESQNLPDAFEPIGLQ